MNELAGTNGTMTIGYLSVKSTPLTKEQQDRIDRIGRIWAIKRIALYIVWFTINVVLLIVGALLVSKYLSDFLLLWFAGCFFYGIVIREVSTEIIDAIIGSEASLYLKRREMEEQYERINSTKSI